MTGSIFPQRAGYIEWADTNSIVVLFPQVSSANNNLLLCWDWLGQWTNGSFLTYHAPQVQAVMNMIAQMNGSLAAAAATHSGACLLSTTLTMITMTTIVIVKLSTFSL